MPQSDQTRAVARKEVQVLCAFALAIASQSVQPAVAADTGRTAGSLQRLVEFQSSGSGTTVPHSDSPKGCLTVGKGICTGKYTGTIRGTLFSDVGQIRGVYTIDFTKPQVSAAGACFPQLVSGITHSSRGDLRNVEQGTFCIPAAAAGLPAGYALQTRPGILLGGTGAFEHLFATMQTSVSISPSGSFMFRNTGVATGID